MVKKHMKEVKAVDKQDLEMTDHEPMPPAFCILHLLQSELRTNEILIGQQIIARVKTHCTDADLTIDYLPPRWPDSLRLSKLNDILKRAD